MNIRSEKNTALRACRHALVWLWLVGLAGCAPQEITQPPAVESATPSWPKSETPALPPAAEPVAAPEPPAISQAEFGRLDEALASQRQRLREAGYEPLQPEDVGYYLDTLEARLIQLLRGTGVDYRRDSHRFEMAFASGNSFETNTARLTAAAVEQLAPVLKVLNEYDRTKVLVYGHTDAVGDPAYNLSLSLRRAEAVATLLADGGVDPRRILIAGFGETRPVAENDSDSGRARNRRVELIVEALVD